LRKVAFKNGKTILDDTLLWHWKRSDDLKHGRDTDDL